MTTIKIQIIIPAPIHLVWDCWTKPEHILKWNHASNDWHTTKSENELKIGGKFLSRMEAKDGSFGFDFTGFYTEIKLHKRIGYTMDDGRKASIQFSENNNEVLIIEKFEAETENTIELQQQGWQSILNNFKIYVESQNKTLKL